MTASGLFTIVTHISCYSNKATGWLTRESGVQFQW